MATEFIVTDAGLSAAINAEETGAKIVITSFSIGSGYGYEPSSDATGFQGNTLFTGTPSSYKTIDTKSKLIVCELPPETGPFTFGEIGLWMDDVLFAICVFEDPIEKYTNLENNISSSCIFNCILSLEQGSATITLDFEDTPSMENLVEIERINTFAEVKSPTAMGYGPFINEAIVAELSKDGRQTLLLRDTDSNSWSVASTYDLAAHNVTLLSVSSTSFTCASDVIDDTYLDTTSGFYLVQLDKNNFRRATASKSGGNIRFTWAKSVAGLTTSSECNIYFPQSLLEYLSLTKNNLFDTLQTEYVTLETAQTITGQKTFTEVILGTAQHALWSDLAELYSADKAYEPGTLVQFGGKQEVTAAVRAVNGVVSTKPGFLLNAKLPVKYPVPLALSGRVPVKVVGRVNKFDKIVLSAIPGVGVVDNSAGEDKVIARALRSNHTADIKCVLCATRISLL